MLKRLRNSGDGSRSSEPDASAARAARSTYPRASRTRPRLSVRDATPRLRSCSRNRSALDQTPRPWLSSKVTPQYVTLTSRRLPESDPAPPGRPPPPWRDPPPQWREIASRALLNLPLADLTVVGHDGFPICVPVRPGALRDDEVPLQVGPGAPELPVGPACLTVHGHDESFTTQENHTLIGVLERGSSGLRLRLERALADWSLTGNGLQCSVGFLRKGRRLAPRLKTEAARRAQPVPTVHLP